MGPVLAILSGVVTIFFYALIIAAVWKLFQVATDLGEIKTILSDIRRGSANPAAAAPVLPAFTPMPPPLAAQPPVLAGPISLESAEALLRQVAAESQALDAVAQAPKTTA